MAIPGRVLRVHVWAWLHWMASYMRLLCCAAIVAWFASMPPDATGHSATALEVRAFTFFAVSCTSVLLGPLLGVLPDHWHGESARALAAARILLVLICLQEIYKSPSTLPSTGPHLIRTGLPEWTSLTRWKAEWLSITTAQHSLLKVAMIAALLGVLARPALLLAAVLVARECMLRQSHAAKVDHGGQILSPMLFLFGLSPCSDALALQALVCRRKPPRKAAEYALPFTCTFLLLACAYLTAGWAKITDCQHTEHISSAFWNSTHLRDIMHSQYFSKCQGAS